MKIENLKSSKNKTICYIKGIPHKTLRIFLGKNFTGHKGVVWYILSAERNKYIVRKNILPGNVIIKNWRKDEQLSRQTKSKTVHHHKINLISNVKKTSLTWKENARIYNKKTYKNKNLIGESKYMVKVVKWSLIKLA